MADKEDEKKPAEGEKDAPEKGTKPEAEGKKPAGEAKKAESEEPPPPPPDPPFVKKIRERFGEAILESSVFADEPTIVVGVENLIDACVYLRDDEEMKFDYLACISSVDYPERVPRFDLIYNLYSIKIGHRLNVIVRVEENKEVPTVSQVWITANWQEREIWDLMGITFADHPNLKRILLPDWWEGHPLRKDYPLEGRGEEQKVIEECQKLKY
ncbi:NADH-quinone oxidoreductase subunit C [Acidobacteriota bacterium]